MQNLKHEGYKNVKTWMYLEIYININITLIKWKPEIWFLDLQIWKIDRFQNS